MKKLYELRDKLCNQLAEYSDKELSTSVLDVVDKLAHATKNIDKIIDKCEDGEYSGAYRSYYPRYGSYDYGMSYDNRGRGSMRDSGGRYNGGYSGHDDMIHELNKLMDEAPDERTRMELQKFIQKMQTI